MKKFLLLAAFAITFAGCTNMSNNQIQYISDGEIVIPYNSDDFGASIISNTCKGEKGVIVFDGPVLQIGDKAFYECIDLTSITIPDSVIEIGDDAFSYCNLLINVVIPESVATIGDHAFSYCTSLASVTIPDSVTEIGDYGFYKCSALADIYCMAEVPPTLGSEVFTGVPSELKIYVPRASVEAYKSALYWRDYAIVGYDF